MAEEPGVEAPPAEEAPPEEAQAEQIAEEEITAAEAVAEELEGAEQIAEEGEGHLAAEEEGVITEAGLEGEGEGGGEGEGEGVAAEQAPEEPVEGESEEPYKEEVDELEIDLEVAGSTDFIIKEDEKDLKKKDTEKKKAKALGSIISIRRGMTEFYDRSKIPRYMNTYKLESDKPFNAEKVEAILKEVLIEALENLTYDPDKVPKQAKWASSAIRARVKEQEYDRYKIICIVTIGEKISQDIYTIFRFLWDCERDRFAKYSHENLYLYAFAMCFGLYYE